jgi:hypothetical protein
MTTHHMPFQLWRCLGRAVWVLGRNFVPFMALAILITAPPEIYDLTIGNGDLATRTTAGMVADLVVWFVGYVFVNLLSAALVFGTTQELRGRHAGIGACVRRGLPLIVPTLAASIVVAVITGFGLLLLVVPGLVFFLMYWLVIPVVVMERPGVRASLRRSAQLTKGVRWRLFGTILVPVMVGVGLQFLVAWSVGTDYLMLASNRGPAAGVIAFFLVNALASAYFAVVNAVAYYDIRQAKEHVAIEKIAAVFD